MQDIRDIPVLLMVYRRPEKTKALLAVLEKIQPRNVFVICNGFNPDHTEDYPKIEAVRALCNNLAWPCTVTTKFRDQHATLTENISEGITWFFSQVPEGIIFEDDCIPHESFFTYCAELLDTYRNDTRIVHISGNNFQDGQKRGDASYYFSHYSHSWGWATWRRAWGAYAEAQKKLASESFAEPVESLPFSPAAKKFWKKALQNKLEWDGRWLYTTWLEKGLCILPNVNLVTNIGFDAESTHTYEKSGQADVPLQELATIAHPTEIAVNNEADEYTFQTHFYKSSWARIRYRIRGILTKLWKKVR